MKKIKPFLQKLINRINKLNTGIKRILLLLNIIATISIIFPATYFMYESGRTYIEKVGQSATDRWTYTETIYKYNPFLCFIIAIICFVIFFFIPFWTILLLYLWIYDGFQKDKLQKSIS